MVDIFTQTSSVSNLVTTAYDTAVESQNRHVPLLRNLPDKHLVSPTHAGSTFRLQKYNDLAIGSAELTELGDPDAVQVPQTVPIDVAFREFGRVVFRSKKLDLTSMTQIDPIIVDVLARDLAVSLDDEVGVFLYGGTNVRYAAGTSTATVTAASRITAQAVREMVTGMRTRAASPRRGDLYWCGIHPNVALDLRTETGANAWRDDHKYAAPDVFWPGETGVYEGAFFVESARMKRATDGLSSAPVYRTVLAGRQALAEVSWEAPHSVIGDIPVDKLQRHRPFGWYGALNWARYREENLIRLESSATL
jgi:N4-gp56 family major capsid protein